MIKYFNITYKCNSSCMFCAADIRKRCNHPNDMTVEEVLKVINSDNMKENDRIIINGGEPTLCEDFENIIDVCKRRKIIVDLYTNGKRFSENSFSMSVIENGRMYIRVPLFGAREKHDYLTGVKGNYEKTISGIKNIIGCIDGKMQKLEIKLLLSKITVETNLDVLKYLHSNGITNKCIVSLNPLLISNSVIENKDVFIDEYGVLMEKSREMVEYAKNNKIKLITPLIPICTIPIEIIDFLMSSYNYTQDNARYYNKNGSKNDILRKNHSEKPQCGLCKFKEKCPKFPESYLEYFHLSEEGN